MVASDCRRHDGQCGHGVRCRGRWNRAGLAKSGSVEAGSPGESAAPRHGPPLHELESRKEGQDYKGRLAPLVVQRRGLAVITDFSNARLEDWTRPGFTNADQIEDQLRLMEEHWAWLSRGLESFHWDIIRVTLPVELRPDAYPHFGAFRDAVAPLIRKKVDISKYDSMATTPSIRHGSYRLPLAALNVLSS